MRVLAEAAASELTLTAPLATLASSVALELLNCWDSLSQGQETAALASQAALLPLPLTLYPYPYPPYPYPYPPYPYSYPLTPTPTALPLPLP